MCDFKDFRVYSKYDRPVTLKEKGGGPSRVERGDAIPVSKQLRMFLKAGVRLADVRRAGIYDYDDPKEVPDDIQLDPTRSYMFDLADASSAINSIKPVSKKEIEEKKDEEIEEKKDEEKI